MNLGSRDLADSLYKIGDKELFFAIEDRASGWRKGRIYYEPGKESLPGDPNPCVVIQDIDAEKPRINCNEPVHTLGIIIRIGDFGCSFGEFTISKPDYFLVQLGNPVSTSLNLLVKSGNPVSLFGQNTFFGDRDTYFALEVVKAFIEEEEEKLFYARGQIARLEIDRILENKFIRGYISAALEFSDFRDDNNEKIRTGLRIADMEFEASQYPCLTAHHVHPLLLEETVRECEMFLKLSGIEGIYGYRNRLDSTGQSFWLTRNQYFDQGFWDGTWEEKDNLDGFATAFPKVEWVSNGKTITRVVPC